MSDPTYTWQSKLVGRPVEFRLTEHALEWTDGKYGDRIPYGRIARVRMSFRPVTLATYRFLTEIWPKNGPKLKFASTSTKSVVLHEQRDAEYRAFTHELGQRLAAKASNTRCDRGVSPLVFWIGVGVAVSVGAALLVLVFQALTGGHTEAAAFLALVAGVFGWQFGGFLWRNVPGRFDPGNIPSAVLPREPAPDA